MKPHQRLHPIQLATALWLLAIATTARGQTMEFTELLDDELSNFTIENTTADNFTAADGIVEVREPEGWLKSTARYADFELVAEFRFMTEDADSGIFLRVLGDQQFVRGWPNQSYQVQLRNPLGQSPFPPVGGLFRHAMANGDTRYDEDLAREVCLPTGQWQVLHVRVEGETLEAELNGRVILTADSIGNESGFIGLQGETGSLEFRSLRIREL